MFIGRTVALAAGLALLTSWILLVQLISDAAIGLQIDATRVVSTVMLLGALALVFGVIAMAIAGWYHGRRHPAVGAHDHVGDRRTARRRPRRADRTGDDALSGGWP